MDVALVGSHPPPHGGQAVHIQNLANFLRSQGLDVQVFNTGLDKDVHEDGVVNIRSSRDLLRTLLFGPRFKVIHVHVSSADDFGKLAPVTIAALARGVPWITTIHAGNSAQRLRASSPTRRAAARAVLARAQKIICVNAAIGEEVSSLVSPKSITVISPFSVDFSTSTLKPELATFLASHAPIVSCVGLYDPIYGFDQAIHLLAIIRESYPNTGLLLIGDQRNSEPYEELISRLHLANDVKLCGNLEHQECLEVMSRSALFVRPTLYDGDALSVREALALGVRVVASATDFRPSGVFLCRPDVPGDIAAKALQALGSDGATARPPRNDFRNLEEIRRLYAQVMTG